MRHLRTFAALLAIAAITVACSSSPGASSGLAANATTGAQLTVDISAEWDAHP